MVSGRLKATCSECRRRKQKCSGSWPCSHCVSRRVVPRCHFGVDDIDAPVPEREKKRRRMSHRQQAHESVDLGDDVSLIPSFVKRLGYSNGLAHLSIDHPETSARNETKHHCEQDQRSLREAMQALPPRSLTDSLVEYYLEHVNVTYCAIHRESFVADYQQFCETRRANSIVSPAFVCLLLQICANTLQEVDGILLEKVEYELGEMTDTASIRLRACADTLSHTILPGSGGVHQSLHFLVAAAWLKSQGQIVEAWHSLARAVREEQECRMHQPNRPPNLSDMDHEVRTRTWCYTMLWDWQMAHWLDRPFLIDMSAEHLHTPNLTIDRSADGAPSPFANTFNQYKLAHLLHVRFGRLGSNARPEQVQHILHTISGWAAELPPELAWEAPNRDFDAGCSWVVLQRLQLRTFAAMVQFTPLKEYLIYPDLSRDEDLNLRQVAKTCAIECINAAVELLAIITPVRTRFHFVTFVLFDTTTAIISAVLHDTEGDLKSNEDLLQATSLAIHALQNTARLTTFAKSATSILKSLVSKLPPCWAHRLQTCVLDSVEELESSMISAGSEQAPSNPSASITHATESSRSSSDVPDQTLTPPSEMFFDTFGEFDLNGIEQIWDWQALDLELDGAT